MSAWTVGVGVGVRIRCPLSIATRLIPSADLPALDDRGFVTGYRYIVSRLECARAFTSVFHSSRYFWVCISILAQPVLHFAFAFAPALAHHRAQLSAAIDRGKPVQPTRPDQTEHYITLASTEYLNKPRRHPTRRTQVN